MRCKIEGITHNGEGVGRVEGKAVFIPYAVPGELVDIEILEDKGRYARARLSSVLELSPGRREALCPNYYECGGCAYQHVDYSKQLELKRQVVSENLQRLGKIDIPVNPVIGMEEPWKYRNKVTWHVQKLGNEEAVMGYYQQASRNLVPIDSCPLISDKMNTISSQLQNLLPLLDFGDQGEITLRESSFNHQCMLILNGLKNNPVKQIIGILSQLVDSIYLVKPGKYWHLAGRERLQEKIRDITFYLSPLAFFQVNSVQTGKMINIILNLNDFSNEMVLDAYCGIGSIALNIAPVAERVVGVESSRSAVKDAIYNSQVNNLNNCEFIHGPCEKILPELKEQFDTVILDPPRSGCRREVVDSIIKISPRTIIYVSCNPSTLARDLSLFAQGGFKLIEVQPIDLFPQTYHVECVVLMSRADK
ncbi:MAG: 23S rRNA (uracil(1939)-C(5))-methyltransferase RlmD [Syntrophomonas sp.]